MPFIYASHNKMGAQALENLTTNGTGNTETDFFFLKPGATRVINLLACRVQGKGNALTSLTGISIRLKQWTASASASTGATSVTPQPKHNLSPACAATAGLTSTASSGVTSGTTGVYVGMATCGASGPGGWVAANPDDVPSLDGNASKSQDLVSSSPTVSMNFEFSADHSEG